MTKKFSEVELGSDIIVNGLSAFKMSDTTAIVWSGAFRNEKGFFHSWKNGDLITIDVDPSRPVEEIKIDQKELKKHSKISKRYEAVRVFVVSSLSQSRKS